MNLIVEFHICLEKKKQKREEGLSLLSLGSGTRGHSGNQDRVTAWGCACFSLAAGGFARWLTPWTCTGTPSGEVVNFYFANYIGEKRRIFWKTRHLLWNWSTTPEAPQDESPLVYHTFRSPEGVKSRVCHPKCVFWDIGFFQNWNRRKSLLPSS